MEAFRARSKREPVAQLCGLLGYSRQAYYKSLQQQQSRQWQQALIVGLVQDKRKIWKRGSGRNLFKSLQQDFKAHHIKIGRDKFFDLLRQNGLLIKVKKRKVSTTDSYHRYHKYPNLIKGVQPLRCNEVWVSDITYIWLRGYESFCYLFLITDMYSRKILGYCVSESLAATGALKSLQMAFAATGGKRQQGIIHHSDRGVQYCCTKYVSRLIRNGFKISMTEQGDPLDNPIAERVNKTIKEEFTDQKEISFVNIGEAQKQIKSFIDFYNSSRPHRSLDWLTPAEAYKTQGELKRHWKAYNRKAKGILEA